MMKLKRKNSLDLYIGIFWLVNGAFTFQGAWFIISIATTSKELWFQVLEVTGKNAMMNFMIAEFLIVAGIFQLVFGLFMIVTRDSSADKHIKLKKSKFEPKED